jgi:ribosomal protein S18 acetylase RimI-like enzyme
MMRAEEPSIRQVRADDLQALLELYRHLLATDSPLPDEDRLNTVWRQIISSPMIVCLVAELGGRLVGSCIMTIIPNLTRGTRSYGLIENVVTHADYRRRGIGTSVLRRALQIAWTQNCYKVMLLTGSKKEETLLFYEKAGFRRGIKTGFIATSPIP